MAAPHTSDDPRFGDLDLGNTAQVLLRGVSQEQHQRHSQELARLQAMYVLLRFFVSNVCFVKIYTVLACY